MLARQCARHLRCLRPKSRCSLLAVWWASTPESCRRFDFSGQAFRDIDRNPWHERSDPQRLPHALRRGGPRSRPRSDKMLRRVSLPLDSLDRSRDLCIAVASVRRLLEVFAAASGAETFGLRMAASGDLSLLGPVALVVREQPAIGTALEALARSIHIHNEGMSLAISRHDDLVTIDVVFRGRAQCQAPTGGRSRFMSLIGRRSGARHGSSDPNGQSRARPLRQKPCRGARRAAGREGRRAFFLRSTHRPPPPRRLRYDLFKDSRRPTRRARDAADRGPHQAACDDRQTARLLGAKRAGPLVSSPLRMQHQAMAQGRSTESCSPIIEFRLRPRELTG